jgi:hypothetical protein
MEISMREQMRQREIKHEADLANMRLEKQKEREEIALRRSSEADSFVSQREELEHQQVLDAIRNELALKNLDVRERSRIVEGGLTDRELSEVIMTNLGSLGNLYRSSNITVFGEGQDSMAALIPPISSFATMIREALSASRTVGDPASSARSPDSGSGRQPAGNAEAETIEELPKA